jgi:hypothetical protein
VTRTEYVHLQLRCGLSPAIELNRYALVAGGYAMLLFPSGLDRVQWLLATLVGYLLVYVRVVVRIARYDSGCLLLSSSSVEVGGRLLSAGFTEWSDDGDGKKQLILQATAHPHPASSVSPLMPWCDEREPGTGHQITLFLLCISRRRSIGRDTPSGCSRRNMLRG